MARLKMKRQSLIPQGLAPGSLNRGVILLRAIAQGSRKGSVLTELVARTALPRPTIHRVMDQLIDIGWVIRDPVTHRFNLGMELAALGYSAMSRNPIEKKAAPHLAMLAERINQVIYLNVKSGFDSVCIGRYEGNSQIQVGKGMVGMRMPFGMSPSCMAMLARFPEEEIEELIKGNMSRYYRIDGFDETGFRKAVGTSVQKGYSTYDGIVLDRTTSGLGVPILDTDGYPIAGIGTTYITGWLSEDQWRECLDELRDTSRQITSMLFHTRPPL